jgi:hypothetical protein
MRWWYFKRIDGIYASKCTAQLVPADSCVAAEAQVRAGPRFKAEWLFVRELNAEEHAAHEKARADDYPSGIPAPWFDGPLRTYLRKS